MTEPASRPAEARVGHAAPGTSGRGPAFGVACLVGGAVMAWGVWLYLDATPDLDRRVDLAVWLVGADIVHDALVAPAACLAGAALARVAPPVLRAPLQAALFATAMVLLVAYPPLTDTAAITDNPTIQPLDYATAVLWPIGAAWLAAATWLVVRLVRDNRAAAT